MPVIERAHRVADRIGLFADRNVGLAVCQRVDVQRRVPLLSFELEEIRLFAAFVDEVAGKLEIFCFAGRIGQLAERELNLLVARIAVNFAGLAAEHGCDVIGVAAERVEEFPAAGGAEVGGRFGIPSFQARRNTSIRPVSRHLATEDGIVDVRHASTRPAKTGSFSFTAAGSIGENGFMAEPPWFVLLILYRGTA